MSERRLGFTLIEAMIAVLILSVILYIVNEMISSGRRGTLHGQEAADHHLAEIILSRALEKDLKSMIPCPIHTVTGDIQATVKFDPTLIAATFIQFSRFSECGIIQVQYSFDEGKREVRRLEIGSDGVLRRTDRFGTGMVTRFTLEDCSPDLDASLFWMVMEMKGKLRTTHVDKVFPSGFPAPGPARAWNFQIQ